MIGRAYSIGLSLHLLEQLPQDPLILLAEVHPLHDNHKQLRARVTPAAVVSGIDGSRHSGKRHAPAALHVSLSLPHLVASALLVNLVCKACRPTGWSAHPSSPVEPLTSEGLLIALSCPQKRPLKRYKAMPPAQQELQRPIWTCPGRLLAEDMAASAQAIHALMTLPSMNPDCKTAHILVRTSCCL